MPDKDCLVIYRVIDANLNRLREGLRVIEEFFRFVRNNKDKSIELKLLRHSTIDLESGFGLKKLLKSRDTTSDPFADKNRKEELRRTDNQTILLASFKRSQEAARVIEEYAKITDHVNLSEKAKLIRFSLYNMEKEVL
ncbi:MAG: thiamine-phosphate pyrophosphorylase [Chitinispirillia bacterium]